MEVSARRAFALLKSLAFERLSGSDAEKCAAALSTYIDDTAAAFVAGIYRF